MYPSISRFVPPVVSAVLLLVELVLVDLAFVNLAVAQPEIPSLEQMFSEELSEIRGTAPTPDPDLTAHRARVEKLITYLYSPNRNEQFQSTVTLRRIATVEDLPRLMLELPKTSNNPLAEISLVGVIGKIGSKDSIPGLIQEFELSKRDVQLAIVDALGEINDETTIDLLARLLRLTTDVEYLQRTLAALAKIGGPRSSYAIESTYPMLPDGAPKITAQWAKDLADRKIDLSAADREFKPGLRSTLIYKGLLYYFYRPTPKTKETPDPWLLVCLHGSDLQAEALFNTCFGIAKQYGLALLVPFFDPVFFPDYGNLNVRGQRADRKLLELIEFVGREAKVKTQESYLFGIDEGGDLLQRFILLHPDRVARAVFLTPRFVSLSGAEYFPVGNKRSPEAPDAVIDLSKVVKVDFAVLGDKTIFGGKPFKAFTNALVQHAEMKGLYSRVRYRQSNISDLGKVWETAHRFLFPAE